MMRRDVPLGSMCSSQCAEFPSQTPPPGSPGPDSWDGQYRKAFLRVLGTDGVVCHRTSLVKRVNTRNSC